MFARTFSYADTPDIRNRFLQRSDMQRGTARTGGAALHKCLLHIILFDQNFKTPQYLLTTPLFCIADRLVMGTERAILLSLLSLDHDVKYP